MSLIGSLEDLGLGDILQIISLSQKSGVLEIRSEHGEGRIAFLDGLVRGAILKGGPSDLRGVLVGGGLLDEDEFDSCAKVSADRDESLVEVVIERTSVSADRIDSLQREAVEIAVTEMFTWGVGEFSFDVREQPDADDPPIFVPAGINAQYLAMECSRLGDEAGRDFEIGEEECDDSDLSAHEMFGVAAEAPAEARDIAVEAIAESALASADSLGGSEPVDSAPGEASLLEAPRLTAEIATGGDPGELIAELLPSDGGEAHAVHALEPIEPIELIDPIEPIESLEVGRGDIAEETGAPVAPSMPPLVVIDPDLPVLEWVKDSVSDHVPQIHIFQRSDLGLARIRQYMVRGRMPIVLVSRDMPGDPLAGIPDAVDFVRRLKGQVERMTILWLAASDALPEGPDAPADARVVRPAAHQLRNAGAAHQREELASELRAALTATQRGSPTSASDSPKISPEAMHKLKELTAALRDASSRGEVLPLVIRFASESFSRVAMFAVLDGSVVGMAQSGLALSGGPDDAALRQVRLEASDSAWVCRVLDTRGSVRGPVDDAGDRALTLCLGERVPTQAYLAPIESAGHVVALLYGDNLPDDAPLEDTSALEVVLHHAGLALDRAALERALREAQG